MVRTTQITVTIEGTPSEVAQDALSLAEQLNSQAPAYHLHSKLAKIFDHALSSPVASLGGYSKLSLIKAVRAVCGVSLKEAKDIVEGLQP